MLDYKIITFLKVCELKNYTKAAQELNLTQPAITQQIRALEEYYQVKLFDYQNRNLTLTPQGEALQLAMTTMHYDIEKLKLRLEQMKKITNDVHFAATQSLGEYYVPKLVIPYWQKHPNVIMNYQIDNTKSLLKALKNGEIDFAFVEGTFNKSEFDYITIDQQRFIAVTNAKRKIESINNIEQLSAHPIIVREVGSGGRDIVEQFLSDNGYHLNDFQEVSTFNSINSIVRLLEADLGISFMYEMVVFDAIKKGILKEVKIAGFDVVHEFNFIWRKDSLFKEEYLKILKEIKPDLHL